MTTTPAPNHHANFPTFEGLSGTFAALAMTLGRGDDAAIAAGLAQLNGDDQLVDIGCGTGTATRLAALDVAHVTGVDPSPPMRRVARLLSVGRTPVTYLDGTAEALPLPDDQATVAWSLATVHHWNDIDRGLAEVRRVLVTGGRFVALERCVQPGAIGHAGHGWTEEQGAAFAAACEEHGFTQVTVVEREGRRGPFLGVTATAR